MYDMRTASVRYLQHHLAEVLEAAESGEEVIVTRRNRPVARIVAPSPANQRAPLPDFAARLEALYPDGPIESSQATLDRERDAWG